MIIPLDASGLNFRAGPGLGWAASAFYSVRQLKTAFRAGLGSKKIFSRPSRSMPTPSGKVCGWDWRGPGSKCSGIFPTSRTGSFGSGRLRENFLPTQHTWLCFWGGPGKFALGRSRFFGRLVLHGRCWTLNRLHRHGLRDLG
jgi:hypothetical protein